MGWIGGVDKLEKFDEFASRVRAHVRTVQQCRCPVRQRSDDQCDNDSRIVAGTYSSGSTTASFSGPLGHLQPFSFPQFSPLDPEHYPTIFTTYANGLNNSQEIVAV
jgi:hypothetical protein